MKAGYKQTEVGEIPESWDIVPLKNAVEFLDGKRRPVKMSDRSKMRGIYPYYGASGIVDYVNDYLFDDDLILLGEDGENILSRSTRLAFKISGKIWVNNHAHVLKPQPGFNIGYLCEFLESLDYTLLNSGTAQPKLNKQTCEKILVAQPTTEEQKAIAKALSDVDELIFSLKKLVTKKRDIKTATMQQLLTGKLRLPGFGEGKGYKQTELGEIPEDWDVKNIGSFTSCTAGGTPNTKIFSYWGGDNPWMSSGELHLKRVKDVEARITDVGLKNSSTKYIPKYCVLMGLAGQGKTRGTVAVNEIELCTNQSIAAIFPSDQHETDFLFYNLETRYEELRGMSTGDGGRGGLNLTIIKKIPIAMPSIEEQEAIVSVLLDIDKEVDYLEQRLEKTKAIKRGMMQELLTGRTRLVDAAGTSKTKVA